MANIAISDASQLTEAARSAVESLLGRRIADDEQVRVMALCPDSGPTGTAREAAAVRLTAVLDSMAAHARPVSGGEFDEAVDEAMRHVRPSYR